MKPARIVPLGALGLLPALLAGCGERDAAAGSERTPVVYTTFYPTTWLAQRIAGDALEVVCPLPPGTDPIFWQPGREVLAAYQQADLIVVNGAEFEKWVAGASLPESRVVDTTRPLAGTFLTFETTTHSHGPTGEHTHEGIDGHTWVDPLNGKLQAREIAKACAARWPEHAAAFEQNRRALDADLDALHERLRALVPALERAALCASHPAYDYLAGRHGLALESFDFDPQAELGDAELARVAAHLATLPPGDGPKLLLWESQPLASSVERLRAQLGVESVLFSPCESPPESGDYLSEMNANLARLEAATLGG